MKSLGFLDFKSLTLTIFHLCLHFPAIPFLHIGTEETYEMSITPVFTSSICGAVCQRWSMVHILLTCPLILRASPPYSKPLVMGCIWGTQTRVKPVQSDLVTFIQSGTCRWQCELPRSFSPVGNTKACCYLLQWIVQKIWIVVTT